MSVSTYLNKVYDWLEEPLEIYAITDDITNKYVPPHVNIFYCLGGITLTFHRWSASMVVLMMILYVFRVYLTGRFKNLAVKIVTSIPEAIPIIGSPLVELLRGSSSVGQFTLTRFYSLHTFVLSLLIAVFTLMYFSMIRKQGIFGPL
ncbi:hypothetical protein M9H77_08237 [Catharanthus roseus]|uniref:Uncharacterized protein n=1 Tax=Catharanthus roseus TaxID=4058 RepID=A0ACC0BX57_CATRO|nr:hypothetical protein M9H77_08237 [Catharanthus roseus]